MIKAKSKTSEKHKKQETRQCFGSVGVRLRYLPNELFY